MFRYNRKLVVYCVIGLCELFNLKEMGFFLFVCLFFIFLVNVHILLIKFLECDVSRPETRL